MSAPTAPQPNSEAETALAARVAAGDGEALQDLHGLYAPLVFHLACKTLDRAAAEEITQDVFMAVWRKAADFDPQRGALRTWLLAITHHRILDELRRRSRRPQVQEQPAGDLELAAQDPLPDEALWRNYQRQAIGEALAALPEAQRRALGLAFFGELSHERVADMLRVPLGTVKTRIRAGLRGLVAHLGSLVAGILLLAGLPGLWLAVRHFQETARTGRALELLANSSVQALRLTPPAAAAAEDGTHAAFRAIPGRDLAVLTLSHFPPPPAGQHLLLRIRTGDRQFAVPLRSPGADGKSLQILEGIGLGGAWPVELLITREPARAGGTPGPVLVRWAN